MNKKTSLHFSFAIAACSYSLPALAEGANEILLQLTPAGIFQPADGRELTVPHWNINQAIANQVIARFNARNQPVVIDYEHQTLRKEENGQPAPAAAWVKELVWREGEGLFARAELTTKARQHISDKEYLYISPVFRYATNGDVTEIEMAALTNTPALHGMQALELRAAATFGYQSDDEEQPMNKLLTAIIAGLALQATATEDDAVVALNAHFAKDPLKGLRDVLGAPSTAGEAELVAACNSLKSKNPDPTNYAPVAVMNELKGQVAALTQKLNARDEADVDSSIQAALADGRLLPAQESWAKDLGKTNRAALTSFLATAQPIAALNASQTKNKAPAADPATGLTQEELAVCSHMGISPENYKKAKAEDLSV